ncbi:hypothetical protein [Bradyrhizobium sp. USDA 4486]
MPVLPCSVPAERVVNENPNRHAWMTLTVEEYTLELREIIKKLPRKLYQSSGARRNVRKSPSPAKYQVVPTTLMSPNKSPALTIANGSRPSEIASKFLKFCWVRLLGMVTWAEI